MNQTFIASLLAGCTLLGAAQAASAQDFSLIFRNQRVTIVARDVPVSRILDRWSNIGGTVVVNGAAIQGGPVTLQLLDVPEREALEILLRAADGYIIAERDDATPGASSISKILILPKSASARNQPPPLNAAIDRPGTAPIDAQAQQAFVPPPPEFVQPAQPPSPAEPQAGASGALLIPVSGVAKPGEVTAPLPPAYKPGSAPTAQPGQAPPPVSALPMTHPPGYPGNAQ